MLFRSDTAGDQMSLNTPEMGLFVLGIVVGIVAAGFVAQVSLRKRRALYTVLADVVLWALPVGAVYVVFVYH